MTKSFNSENGVKKEFDKCIAVSIGMNLEQVDSTATSRSFHGSGKMIELFYKKNNITGKYDLHMKGQSF